MGVERRMGFFMSLQCGALHWFLAQVDPDYLREKNIYLFFSLKGRGGEGGREERAEKKNILNKNLNTVAF